MDQLSLQTAVQLHNAGRLAEAEAIYRQILSVQPNHAHALHLLGLIAGRCGHIDAALTLIKRAIAVAPCTPESHVSIGEQLGAVPCRLPGTAWSPSGASTTSPKRTPMRRNFGRGYWPPRPARACCCPPRRGATAMPFCTLSKRTASRRSESNSSLAWIWKIISGSINA